jgi:hypothetical protein
MSRPWTKSLATTCTSAGKQITSLVFVLLSGPSPASKVLWLPLVVAILGLRQTCKTSSEIDLLLLLFLE